MDARELFRTISNLGNNKIEAIKLLRNESGLSLLDAKNIVDILSGTHRAVRKEEYAPPSPNVDALRMNNLEAHINYLISAHKKMVNAIKTAKTLAEVKRNLEREN